MASLYLRPDLARQMAWQLVRPGPLDEGLRSGLFLSGPRRTGKTTFLQNDLIPALQETGALVIYVDLWSDTQTSPASLVRDQIRKTTEALQAPASSVWEKLRSVSSLDLGGCGFKFGFKLEKIGQPGGATLAQVLMEIVDLLKSNVVLIIDEVQHAIISDEGRKLMLALKAARDAINCRPDTPGHFLFIGTGSHRAHVNELTARRSQAFVGAVSLPYPVLGKDYIEYLFKRLKEETPFRLPSPETAFEAFKTLGHRPEGMIAALRQLQARGPDIDPDEHLITIAHALRSSAADLELSKVDALGGLATAIFERIVSAGGEARGIFSIEAAEEYSRKVGREIKVEEIQPSANELVAENIIMRVRHGVYEITDPFIRELWLEKKEIGM